MTGRVLITADELASHFAIHLAVVGQRSPWVIRDLVKPNIGPRDQAKADRARKELAAQLAATFALSRLEVTRPAVRALGSEL